ncbi:MAG: 3-isopropylmalate dehydratase [candidate division WOR-3 bacterium]|uniref:3-isopropylmalate dehydratase small subunit n=1 Tax=candidate division WOR-3 bacterium TaxID=2052148 RepID=A0A7C3EH52_UNCW3|nr:3-isopropylmalate dehydratase [candidate division WOR-3 bacterium]
MRIWCYGDDINTDMLFPGKYTYTCSKPDEIKPHLLEDLDPEFAKSVQAGDIIIAGRNFGCGSSREQPVVGLKAVGIQAVIAKSFARIFYRAAINQGLLLIEAPEAVDYYQPGMDVELNPDVGRIRIGGQEFRFPKPPPEILGIVEAGGLLEYTRRKLKERTGRK